MINLSLEILLDNLISYLGLRVNQTWKKQNNIKRVRIQTEPLFVPKKDLRDLDYLENCKL